MSFFPLQNCIIDKKLKALIMISFFALLAGCASTATQVENPDGRGATYLNPSDNSKAAGIGIESHDIISMTNQMVEDLLMMPAIADRSVPPRIIMDAKYFDNQGSQAINKNLIVDRMRNGLQRASAGKLQFIGREYVGMIEQERELKREGEVDVGTTGLTRATAGADYRLVGRINTLDQRGANGRMQRFNQINFELVDLESGIIAWSNMYEFEKAAQANIMYR